MDFETIESKYSNFGELKETHPNTARFLLKMHSQLPSWTVHSYQIEYIQKIEDGRKEGRNTLIALPTGMGKTMALFYASLSGRTIYVTPSVALTEEKYDELPALFPNLKVLRDTGSDREARRENPELFDYENQDVIVTTNERLLYMLIGNDRDRIFGGIDYIVFDEIHKVGNIGRGSALEYVLMLLKKYYPNKTLIGLSATLPNYDEFGDWLDANCYFRPSTDRPVPLRPIYADPLPSHIRKSADKREHKYTQLKYFTKTLDGQFLVFMNSKQDIDKFASRFAFGHDNEYDVEKLMTKRVGKHYRNIPLELQKEVLERFNNREIDIIFCTTTLAEGVNTSATNCVVFDFSFWNRIAGAHEPNTYDQIVQIIGRAGRPNMGIDEGRAIFMGDEYELSLARDYVENPQPADSQFGRVLVDKVLNMVVTKQGNTVDEIDEVIKESFLIFQHAEYDSVEKVEQALALLVKYKLLTERNGQYLPTKEGSLTTKNALPVYAVIDFLHQLWKTPKFETFYDVYRVMLSNEDILAQIVYDEKKDERTISPIERAFSKSKLIYEQLPINIYDKNTNGHVLMDHSRELLKMLAMVFWKDFFPNKKNWHEGAELEMLKKNCADHIDRMSFIFSDYLAPKIKNTKQLKMTALAMKLGSLDEGIIGLGTIEGIGAKTIESLVKIGIDSPAKLWNTPYSKLKRRNVRISETRFNKLREEHTGKRTPKLDDFF